MTDGESLTSSEFAEFKSDPGALIAETERRAAAHL